MAGGIINTGSHPKALWPGVHTFWGQVYNEYPKEYPALYENLTSTQAYEEDVQITGFGLAPNKPEGGSLSYDSEIQGWIARYTHSTYGLGYKVTMEEQEDNLYEKISMRRSQANAFSIRQTLETLGAGIYNDAFTGNIFTSPDGLTLCNSAHVNTTGGTFSNALTPAADLTEAALEDVCIQVMGFQTDRGLTISLMSDSLHIARQEIFNSERILKSVKQSGNANNDTNALRELNMFPKGAHANHYFTSAHAWFVRTNCPNGMRMYMRKAPTFAQDNQFDTKNLAAATVFRVSFGNTDPRGIVGSNGP